MSDSDTARDLRMTAADAEHDAECEHFAEAVSLAAAAMRQDDYILLLEDVVEEAKGVIAAYDNAETDADWTGALVDTRLRSAVERAAVEAGEVGEA